MDDELLSPGSVLRGILKVLGARPFALLLAGVAACGLSPAVYYWMGLLLPIEIPPALRWTLYIAVSWTLLSATGAAADIAITRITLRRLSGETANFGDLMVEIRRNFWVVLITWLIIGAPYVAASLLPGLLDIAASIVWGVVASIWLCIVPVRMAEGAGLKRCFARSFQLSRRRLPLVLGFGLFMVTAYWGLTVAAEPQTVSVEGAEFNPLVFWLIDPAIDAIVVILQSVGSAIIYVRLREAEGGRIDTAIGRIFD